MHVSKIKYPVYPIRQYINLYTEDNITYIETHNNAWVLDNKNLPGNYIDRRRKINKIYPLYSTIHNIRELILSKNPTKTYIDIEGNIFKYIKTRYVPLTYHKILKREYLEGEGILLTIDKMSSTVLVSNCLEHRILPYIGILSVDGGYIPYMLSETRKKNTRVKI